MGVGVDVGVTVGGTGLDVIVGSSFCKFVGDGGSRVIVPVGIITAIDGSNTG